MNRANKTKFQIGAMLCMAFLFFVFSSFKITPRLQQKLKNAVQTTFEIEVFELQPVETKSINIRPEDILYKIAVEGKLRGYAYLGKAPSMKEEFDYVVLFNPDLSIKKSKVLIYREDHGRQIGSQRWLKQFIGKKSGDGLGYGKEIDAISGATISAKSMTKAVEKVLNLMDKLKTEQIIQIKSSL
jgi:hypothetical protein